MDRPTLTSDPVMDQANAPPPPSIMQLATGFWVSQALYVAAKLGIADLLENGPQSSEALANAAGAHAGALHRVLRALASFGLFAEDEDGRFRNTRATQPLQTGAPDSLRAFVIMLGEPESWRSWGDMLHSVKTGQSAFEHVFGSPIFQYMAEHHEAARIFDEAMISRSASENEAVLKAYDFSGVNRLIDVGGGRGALLSAILNAWPRTLGVLFDLPHVIDGSRVSLGSGAKAGRCRLVSGDFFRDALPPAGDVYLLKKIIHDWDDERARTILQGCRRAMSGNARLLLIEPIVPPGNGTSFAKLLDLLMLVWPGGRERTEGEHRALLASSGLHLSRVIPTQSPLSIIEASPI